MEPTFPLFRLPENVVLEVLENLCLGQLFEFSLISTKTKNIVTSLGIGASDVRITISRDVGVNVYYGNDFMSLTFYKDPVDQDALIHLDSNQPIPAYFLSGRITVQSSTPFSFKNWLDHIKTIFCYSKSKDMIFFPGNERFDMESVKNAIKSVDQLVLFEANTEFRMRELLENFKNPNHLSLGRNPFEELFQIQEIFIQNFESIIFRDDVSLDDMLLINSERVQFTRSISKKQFNQFLKHWIRGSNPRLQRITLPIDKIDSVNGEIYLKGINCMEMSEEAKRDIRQKRSLSVSVDMIKIRRKDGTTAVIGTNVSRDILYVRFMVFH